MNKIGYFFFVFFLFSCANNMSQNNVVFSERSFTGGVYKTEKWNDEMLFKRVSWYQQLTLIYDVFIHKLDPQSKFKMWFSKDELEEVEKCGAEVLIVFHYAYESKKIPDRFFREEMSKNNFDEIFLTTFSKNLMLHPDTNRWNLVRHKVACFCRKTRSEKTLTVNFPSFSEVSIAY